MSIDSKIEDMVNALERIADNLPDTGYGGLQIGFETDAYNMLAYIGEQVNSCADQQELIRYELKTLNSNIENLNSILNSALMQLVVDKRQ